MARVRRAGDDRNAYQRLVEDDRGFAARYGELWPRHRLDRLEAGLPVVVQGWEIDLRAEGRWEPHLVESDGTVTLVEPVYLDPDVKYRTVCGYRWPDGTRVVGFGFARAAAMVKITHT